MSAGGPYGRLGLIAFLAISLLMTALQAKLGLYRPERSQVDLISEAFKPSECRLDRADPVPPVATVAVVTIAGEARVTGVPSQTLWNTFRLSPGRPLLSSSHWFRPPPARS